MSTGYQESKINRKVLKKAVKNPKQEFDEQVETKQIKPESNQENQRFSTDFFIQCSILKK